MAVDNLSGSAGTRRGAKQSRRGSPRAPKEESSASVVQVETLKEQAQSTHEEARMVLPGIQALFGFQLIAVFNPPFLDLDAAHRMLHLGALVLVAIAIGLIMAPASYRRLAEATCVSRHWIRLSSCVIAWAMAALMMAISLEIYLVANMIADNFALALTLGAGVGCLLTWLWFVLPLLGGWQGRLAKTDHE